MKASMAEYARLDPNDYITIPGYPNVLVLNFQMQQNYVPISTWGHHEILDDWEHVDQHGHIFTKENYWGATTDEVAKYWCELCRDHHSSDYSGPRRCRKCGEPIEPKTKWVSSQDKLIPGTRTCEMDAYGPVIEQGTEVYFDRGKDTEQIFQVVHQIGAGYQGEITYSLEPVNV